MFEAEYWLAMLDDLRALNDDIRGASHATASIPIAVLELLLGGDPKAPTEKAMAATHAAMDGLMRAGETLDRAIELAAGRIAAVRSEAGLES
jgi:hypothetical protein